MGYSLYKLEFNTGVHIGKDVSGPSLDDGRMTIHSDTLFSALCCEAVKSGNIERMYTYFAEGKLVTSDALPYKGEEYFLPKPIIYTENHKSGENSSIKKLLKSIEFIPLSLFDKFIKGSISNIDDIQSLKVNFGYLTDYTRVNTKDQLQPVPYNVACWRFEKNCGLYVIVRFETEEAISFFEETLSALGISGIGGKQTSGLGKFNVVKASVPKELEKLLDDNKANYQMLLGTGLPADGQLEEVLKDSWYIALRRGGFVRSQSYSYNQLKKRTIYMLSPGSCVKKRFDGVIFDLSEGGSHPVWRCGKTLFAGVRI